MDSRIVNVIRESTYREQRRRMMICFGDEPPLRWITVGELYQVLAHGEPGDYILIAS